MYYWNHSESKQKPAASTTPGRLKDKTPQKNPDLTSTKNDTELYVTANNTQDSLIATPKNFGSRLPRSSVSTPKEPKSPDDSWSKKIFEKDSRISELEETVSQLRKELQESRTFISINDLTSANAYKTPPPIKTVADSSLQLGSAGEDSITSPVKISRRTNSTNLCDLKVVTKTFHVTPPAENIDNKTSDRKKMTETSINSPKVNTSENSSKITNKNISSNEKTDQIRIQDSENVSKKTGTANRPEGKDISYLHFKYKKSKFVSFSFG